MQKRKSYLAARDLIRQLNFFNVKKVNIERLNWVEHTGGSWDFSQQQDIYSKKPLSLGSESQKCTQPIHQKKIHLLKNDRWGLPIQKQEWYNFLVKNTKSIVIFWEQLMWLYEIKQITNIIKQY